MNIQIIIYTNELTDHKLYQEIKIRINSPTVRSNVKSAKSKFDHLSQQIKSLISDQKLGKQIKSLIRIPKVLSTDQKLDQQINS